MAAPPSSRCIVITGVTRGLGRALAEEFAGSGHKVAGCGRSADAIEALRGAFSQPHLFAQVDVADAGQVQAWAERVIRDVGVPNLILNNAAIINRTAPLWEVPAEEFNAVIDTNIKGVANVIRSFVPRLRSRGIIVNFSSAWGRSGSPGVGPYCAAKWAIEGMTRALAAELPAGMAAVALNPGTIDTEMLRTCFGDDAAAHQAPREWAKRAAPFLLKLDEKDNGKPLSLS